ncbi:MAG: OmpA family protein, partial [Flavobacteriales bacterium]
SKIIIEYYEPAEDSDVNDFLQLICGYLDAYLDQIASVNENGVIVLRDKPKRIQAHLNDIVRGSAYYFDYKSLDDFETFSPMVMQSLTNISALDFSHSNFAAGAADKSSAQNMVRLYLDKQLIDLKILVRMEIGAFGSQNLLVKKGGGELELSESEVARLTDQYLKAGKNIPLDPIKIQNGDSALVTYLKWQDESVLNSTNASYPKAQMNDATGFNDQQNELSQIRGEIALLRNMMLDIVRMNTGQDLASVGASVVTNSTPASSVSNLPVAINVFFDSGEVNTDASGEFAINEVVDILARRPEIKILVTGYSDKTGNSHSNLRLSEKRSLGVKNDLVKAGIDASRITTRYLGDIDAEKDDASSRRVCIEFL